VSRVSDPVFSTEVASITTLINFELRDEGLGEELALEAFARVRPELYIEGRKTLLAVVELLKTLEDVDGKLMNRIMTKEGTSIWDETELIAELVQSRTEVRDLANKVFFFSLVCSVFCCCCFSDILVVVFIVVVAVLLVVVIC
jgi:dynein heavy chain